MSLLLKTIHLLAVVVFLGNVMTGLFWKAHADRTRDPGIIAHTLHGIIRSDRLFTLPGAAVILIAGVATAQQGGLPVFSTGWLWWSLSLFGLSGAIFALAIAPLQGRMRDLASASARISDLEAAGYRRMSLAWEFWGLLAIAAPLGAFVLMVLKPGG
jgi:uncharacterized membrane protein